MNVVGTSYFDTWANYQVGYDLISQDVANNTSTVKFYGVLNVTGNNISWSWANASVWDASNSLSTSYNNGTYTVVQTTATITHRADGTYSGTLSGTLSSSYKSGTASGTFSLPKIDRVAVVSSVTDFNDETNPTITFTNPAGYRIKAFISVGGTRIVTTGYLSETSTYTFSLTSSQRNQLRQLCTGQTLEVNVGLATYNASGTEIGNTYKTKTMTLVNAMPTFTATYADTNATTLAITNDNQQIIRNNSTLVISISNASAKKYATLTSLSAEINGVTYAGTLSGTTGTINVGILNLSYEETAIVKLTDSRGFVTTDNLTLEILDWELPWAYYSANRDKNFYSDTKINVNATYSSLDGKNTISIKFRYKKTTDQNYGNYITLQNNTPVTETLDNNYEWDVQYLIEDKIGSVTYNRKVSKGIPIVFFDRLNRALGVNCIPGGSGLHVNGENILSRIAGYGEHVIEIENSDWNTACGKKDGFYYSYSNTNEPKSSVSGDDWIVMHLAVNDNFQRQVAFALNTPSDVFTRVKTGGTWKKWTSFSHNYTTSETIIGTWIDGKPLYRKTVSIGNLPSSGGKNTAHSISNLDKVVNIYGFANSNTYKFPLPYTTNTNASNIALYATTTNVVVEVGQNRSGMTGWAVLEYTKTTD